jgi:hypothetical protein
VMPTAAPIFSSKSVIRPLGENQSHFSAKGNPSRVKLIGRWYNAFGLGPMRFS